MKTRKDLVCCSQVFFLFFLCMFYRVSKANVEIISIIDSSSLLSAYIKTYSIVKSAKNPSSLSFRFLVLDNSSLTEQEKIYRGCFPSVKLQFKKWIRPPTLPPLLQKGFDADYIYCRVYLSHIFPDLTRYIYLDNDIVVNMDISQLYKTPLITGPHPMTSRSWKRKFHMDHRLKTVKNENYNEKVNRHEERQVAMGFVFDVNEKLQGYVTKGFNQRSSLFMKAKSFIEPAKFFNGGVALVDAKLWRQQDLTRKAEHIILQNENESLYNRRMLGDQGLFFLLMQDGIAELHPAYNMRRVPNKTTRFLKDSLGIVHFAGTTHGDPKAICIHPLQYPYLSAGAVPLYLSIVEALFQNCPVLDEKWLDVRRTCQHAINKTLKYESYGKINVEYRAGHGRFKWPPKVNYI